MNTLSLLAVCLLTVTAARAAGPRAVEPGAPQVKLDLAAPEAAALPATALPETALPEAQSLAVPASAVAEAAAGAAPAATPAAAATAVPAEAAPAAGQQGVEAQQAALQHEFDGSAAKAADEDSISPELDFGQSVSEAHRALLKEALAAHGDSLAAFFDITGQPRPGFLYVSAARDDSPGAATVVTRVIYTVSGHSSRFDERVPSPFWIGVDVRSKKIEFFTKQPAGASAETDAVSALHRRVAEVLTALDAQSFPGVTWSGEEPQDYVEIPLVRGDTGDEYSYVALVPRGAAPDHFVIRRTGGWTGMAVYSSPVPLASAPAKAALSAADGDDPRVSAATKAAVHEAFAALEKASWRGVTWQRFHRIGTWVRVSLNGPAFGDGYHYTALIQIGTPWMDHEADPNKARQFFVERRGGQTGQTVYAGPFALKAPAASAAVEPARSGRMWTQEQLQDFVHEHESALAGVEGVYSVQVYELEGRPQAVFYLEPGVTEAAARAALEKAVPQITGLYGILGAPSQLSFQPSPIPDSLAAEIRSSFARLDHAKLKWRAAMPIGIRYARMTLHPIAHPEDYGYEALVPGGPFTPGSKMDVSKARYYILAESGGQTGMTRFSQPIFLDHVLVPPFVDLSKVAAGAIEWNRDPKAFPGMVNEVTATFYDAAGNTIMFRFGDNEWAMEPGVTFIPPNLTEAEEHRIVGVQMTAQNAPELAALLAQLVDAAKPAAGDAAALAELRRRIAAFPAELAKLGRVRDELIGALILPQVQQPFRVLAVKAGAYRVEVLVPTHDDAAQAEAFVRRTFPDIAGLVWYSIAGPAVKAPQAQAAAQSQK